MSNRPNRRRKLNRVHGSQGLVGESEIVAMEVHRVEKLEGVEDHYCFHLELDGGQMFTFPLPTDTAVSMAWGIIEDANLIPEDH